MNKLFKLLFHTLVFIIVFFSNIEYASALDLCEESGVTFSFFNGVNTTELEAIRATEEFKAIHGESTSGGEKIKYIHFYNKTNGFEDFVETFEQRLLEQDRILEGRYELYFESLKGGGKWWEEIINRVGSVALLLDAINQRNHAAFIQNITSSLENPPTIENYAEHRVLLDTQIIEGKKLLLVAHSQGNLFVNAAYNYAISKTPRDSVKVVHIAPASPLTNGKHVLADKDLVINALRLIGSVPRITDSIPPYLLRLLTGKSDWLGHGLLEIYINQGLDISKKVKKYIDEALASLVAPPAEATTGFFSATLTWNGSGDVDLHTFEPSLSHVFYRNKQGVSGFLDVDNVTANGPEHYFASCDSDKLQAGTYQISVANYARADGRTATVQISSWLDGVLGTKQVTLGGATRDTPTATLFNVIVTEDSETGEYDVSLSP